MKLRLSSTDKLTKREAHVSQREEDSRLWADRIRAGLEPPASPWRTRERVVEAVRDGSRTLPALVASTGLSRSLVGRIVREALLFGELKRGHAGYLEPVNGQTGSERT